MVGSLQRDAFIEVIHEAARTDDRIVFLSADFGAESLDSFRSELPNQFLHCGISEQHMIDLAGGLALAGKRPFCYAMGPFITLRCLEQIKCSVAIMNAPVVIVGVGVGLGYADSGPTHYLTEDLAVMRAISGLEILTAADASTAMEIARLSLRSPAPRYVRLDREALPDLPSDAVMGVKRGITTIRTGKDCAIVSCGWGVHLGLEVATILQDRHGVDCAVFDLIRLKPLPSFVMQELLVPLVAVLEEQAPPGGIWPALLEAKEGSDLKLKMLRYQLDDRYYFDNAGRRNLAASGGLDPEKMAREIFEALS